MNLTKSAMLFATVLSIAGCAGNQSFLLEPEGAVNPVTVLEPFSECSDWKAVDQNPPAYPRDLMAFLVYGQKTDRVAGFIMSYNILADGTAGNILLESPHWFMEHDAYSAAPKAASEAIVEWRYEYVGAPPIWASARCKTKFSFAIQDR